MWNHGPEIWTRMQRVGVARPVFSGNEMADIVSFLYFLRYADGPGDPVTGKRLFSIKGCGQCHSSALDLSRSAALASPISLMAAMWNHAPEMEEQIQRRGIAWPTFQGNELRELIEYVRASGRQTREKRE
jgi:hypothetical protein